jgi:DNA-binding NarL/FixJ family response regulator
MKHPISIGLVDDHLILLDGIDLLLAPSQDYNVILKEQSGEALLTRGSLDDIELLIMDINMKGKDGIQTLKELREQNYTGACIFLSSYDDLKLVNEAMNLGAAGYVTKGSATEYLEEAIQTVANGGNYYSPDIQQRILTSFSKSSNLLKKYKEPSMTRQLTTREVEVLKFIALQYTSEEISKKLFIAKSTVDTHRKNLIVKLKVKNAVGLGLYAQRHKLI